MAFLKLHQNPYKKVSEFVVECALKNTVTLPELLDARGYDGEKYYALAGGNELDTTDVNMLSDEYVSFIDMLQGDTAVDKTFKQMIEEKGLQNEVKAIRDEYESFFENIRK